MKSTCLICRKHEGQIAAPPGGYICRDGCWLVCHAPAASGPLGTLIVESRRHFLDFSEMEPEEASSLGPLLQKLYAALKEITGAERVYALATVEGAPHIHLWLVPRPTDALERGLAYLCQDRSCDEAEAARLVGRLRAALCAEA